MDYPKRTIKEGEKDKIIVKAVQTQLNAKACGPIEVDGDFGKATTQAAKLFQMRHADQKGIPLEVDGKVGAITWQVLFSKEVLVDIDAPSELLKKAIEIAMSQKGIEESPPYSNRGKEVEKYLKLTGLGGGNAWCAAFVYWCFDTAAKDLVLTNPLPKTAHVLTSWNTSKGKKIIKTSAIENPHLIKAGFVFVMDYGSGQGHTGIVTKVEGEYIHTIEGNTNPGHSREGYGVFELVRKVRSVQKGFIDYSHL